MFVVRRSRVPLAAALVAIGSTVVAPLAHADVKLGYIDSVKILAEYKGVEDAKRAFDTEIKTWEKEEERMRTEIDSLSLEFKSQNLMLTEATRKEKESAIKQKKTDYETFVRSIWGQEGKIVQKNAELMKPIIDKVNVILERLGGEEGFAMIFDAASGGIVYADPGLDLTARVVEELNKGAQ
jgi:outer membrane protein